LTSTSSISPVMSKKWWYSKGDQKVGPFTADEMRAAAASKVITESTLVWKEGLEKWVPARQINGLLGEYVSSIRPPPLQPDDHAIRSSESESTLLYMGLMAMLLITLLMLGVYLNRHREWFSSSSEAAVVASFPGQSATPAEYPGTEASGRPPSGIAGTLFTSDEEFLADLMTENYGVNYLPSAGCWLYAGATDDLTETYCVKIAHAERVATHEGERLYVLATGRPSDENGQDAGSHSSSGLLGAFVVSKDSSGRLDYLARTVAMAYGSYGDAGADDAQLKLLGSSDYYGWIFSSGGMWQGIVVSSHHILAPKGRMIVDLSRLPEMTEDDQAHKYTIEIDSSEATSRVFPITYKQYTINDQIAGESTLVKAISVPFDLKTWSYLAPPGFLETSSPEENVESAPADSDTPGESRTASERTNE